MTPRVATCTCLGLLLVLVALPALATRPAVAGPSATVPATDAYALGSPFSSAIPVHNQCTSIPYCRYEITECADTSQLGVPCGRDQGEEPESAPPHQGMQCKCNYCSGHPGIICAIGHQ